MFKKMEISLKDVQAFIAAAKFKRHYSLVDDLGCVTVTDSAREGFQSVNVRYDSHGNIFSVNVFGNKLEPLLISTSDTDKKFCEEIKVLLKPGCDKADNKRYGDKPRPHEITLEMLSQIAYMPGIKKLMCEHCR